MSRVRALQDAKNQFSKLVDRALDEGPQTVTRHGRKTVVIVAADEYRRMTRPQGSLVEFLRRSPLRGVELKLERSRDTGRKVRL